MQVSQVSKALGRARNLVSHFHHSSKSSYVLKQKQTDLHTDHLSLIQDVATRWNSTYYMIERIIRLQQPLCAALIELQRNDLMPSDTEISTMEIFLEVLKPIVEITEAIGGEKLVTISTIKPLLHKLLSKHLIEKPSDKTLTKTLKNILLTDLSSRYNSTEVKNVLNKACLLDPRFKALSFLPQTEKNDIISMVKEETWELAIASIKAQPPLDPPTKKAKTDEQEKKGLMSLLEDVIKSPSDSNTLPSSNSAGTMVEIKKEMNNHLCLELQCSEDPLQWWNYHNRHFPHLSIMAKKYLSIPATSVPSERAFSVAGYIVNEKRSCLLPENVSTLVFLAANL